MSVPPLLEIRDLHIFSRMGDRENTIVESLSLVLQPGETIGIVGESGSGKSLSMRAVNGLLPEGVSAQGSVQFSGTEILGATESTLRQLRGSSIGMVLQDPFTMLNPLRSAGRHIDEMLMDAAGRDLDKRARRDEAIRRLAEVGITDASVVDRYPFELSGGMRQRVGIAAALARDPELLIADEPSTALDVTTQREILDLMKAVQKARGMGLILITHDLSVAFDVCDRVVVLYAGEVLETSPATRMHDEPLHPYTQGLLLSEPSSRYAVDRLPTMPGSVPRVGEATLGCIFAARCDFATEACTTSRPPLVEVAPDRSSACRRLPEIRSELAHQRAVATVPRQPAPTLGTLQPIIRTVDLAKTFTRRGVDVHALAGVSIEVGLGESVGIVGESGSGKTTLTRCILGLETPSGTLEIGGEPIVWKNLSRDQARRLRQDVQIVFQDPYSSLNPVRTIGSTLREAIAVHRSDSPSVMNVGELLELVGLPAAYAARKPVALSGGERQRVAIARALAVRPRLIICDEPVSALDVSVQAQILNLFADLRTELGMSYLFITHDLSVVRQAVDRVYVMHRGRVVESGLTEQVLDNPRDDYTSRLVSSAPGASR